MCGPTTFKIGVARAHARTQHLATSASTITEHHHSGSDGGKLRTPLSPTSSMDHNHSSEDGGVDGELMMFPQLGCVGSI